MKLKPARFSSTEWPRALASGLESPTLRSLSPAACSMASISAVLPAPVGPTRARARTSPAGLLGMALLRLRRFPHAFGGEAIRGFRASATWLQHLRVNEPGPRA